VPGLEHSQAIVLIRGEYRLSIRIQFSMANMHAPTLPSGPISGVNDTEYSSAGASFVELQAKKEHLESQLRDLSNVLTSVSSVPTFCMSRLSHNV
jgi:hypothetical protein